MSVNNVNVDIGKGVQTYTVQDVFNLTIKIKLFFGFSSLVI